MTRRIRARVPLDEANDPQYLSSQKRMAPRANDRTNDESPEREAELLRLQRAAGNEAVTSLLSGSPASTQTGHSPFDGTLGPLPPVGPMLDDAMRNAGPGSPLTANERERAEGSLGRDLSQVRVHTDQGAGRLTGILGANAATIGNDIYVGPRFEPGTSDWDRLLSHELGHVAQTRGKSGEGGLAGTPGSDHERQADQIGLAIQRGEKTPASGTGSYPTIQMDKPFPTSAAQRVMELDSTKVVDYCKDIANAGTPGVWETSRLQEEVVNAIEGPYFLDRGVSSWSSNEHVVERDWLDLDYKIRVSIRLFRDDNPVPTGEGSEADLSSKGTAESSHGTSGGSSSKTGAGAKAGGKEGGASADVGSEHKSGTSDKQAVGGDVGAESKSTTNRFTTRVYAEVTITMQAYAFMFHPAAHSYTSAHYEIGSAIYTMPTLLAPPREPAGVK